MKMKKYEADRKCRSYALRAVTAEDMSEKHRLEVEFSYLLGKSSAYSEIEALISDNSLVEVELKRALDKVAEDVITEWRSRGLKRLSTGSGFEMGVEAMKTRLVDIILGSIDVTILEVQKRKRE